MWDYELVIYRGTELVSTISVRSLNEGLNILLTLCCEYPANSKAYLDSTDHESVVCFSKAKVGWTVQAVNKSFAL